MLLELQDQLEQEQLEDELIEEEEVARRHPGSGRQFVQHVVCACDMETFVYLPHNVWFLLFTTEIHIFAPLIYSVLRGNSNDRDLNISAFVAKVDPLPEHTIAPISMDEKKDNLFEGVKVDAPDKGDLFETNLPIVTSVPLPQTIWMFGAGLFGLLSVAKRKNIM